MLTYYGHLKKRKKYICIYKFISKRHVVNDIIILDVHLYTTTFFCDIFLDYTF